VEDLTKTDQMTGVENSRPDKDGLSAGVEDARPDYDGPKV